MAGKSIGSVVVPFRVVLPCCTSFFSWAHTLLLFLCLVSSSSILFNFLEYSRSKCFFFFFFNYLGAVKQWWKKIFEFKPNASKYWVSAGAKVPGTPAGTQNAYRYPAPG